MFDEETPSDQSTQVPQEVDSSDDTDPELSDHSGNTSDVNDEIVMSTRTESNWIPSYSNQELRDFQLEDSNLCKVISWVEQGDKPSKEVMKLECLELRSYWNQFVDLFLRDGVLCRRWHAEFHVIPVEQIVAPKSLRSKIFRHLHNHKMAGHLGILKTLHNIRERFYWPQVRQDTRL
jgi:hypothetical protein